MMYAFTQFLFTYLLGNSLVSEFYMPTFREAGELPRRKHATFRARRKFAIRNISCLFNDVAGNLDSVGYSDMVISQ